MANTQFFTPHLYQNIFDIEKIKQAWLFSANKHNGQLYPSEVDGSALWKRCFWSQSYCLITAGGAPLAIVATFSGLPPFDGGI